MMPLLARLCVLIGALLPAVAGAHEMSIAEMELREDAPGEFTWHWSAASDKRASVADLVPRWPDGCVAESQRLHCGEDGLTGLLTLDGIGKRYSAALIKIHWRDGYAVYTVTGSQPDLQLFGSAEDRRPWTKIASAYTGLGVEHILSGIDHLLFVLSLLFLVGFNRKLLLTITAFTLAHSLTLALSALGWLSLRSPPVEASIALSIMLVASEALGNRQTLSRRWPEAVAFLFGLVHGLGFAGALKAIGLPQNHLPMALLSFNVGVEIGQLLLIAAAYLVYRALRGRLAAARRPCLYAIGSVAAFWSIGRILAIAS